MRPPPTIGLSIYKIIVDYNYVILLVLKEEGGKPNATESHLEFVSDCLP